MFTLLKSIVPDQVKELLKDVASTQGGQWVEKKEMRMAEANHKAGVRFNPKTARTRSF
jgi:hypothetical protein